LGPPERIGVAEQGIDEFAKPKVRDDEKSVGRYHALELGAVEIDRSKNCPEGLGGRVDAPRNVPTDKRRCKKKVLRDVTDVDT
jgi:hypothetical protein